MATHNSIAFLKSFPIADALGPVMDAQRYVYNLGPLLLTISEMAEWAESAASNRGERESAEKFDRIKRLLWIASEERDRCEKAVFEGDDVLHQHVEYRVVS